MPIRWKHTRIPRLNGLDLKTNPTDVKDGESLDCENCYQTGPGVVSKRKGVTLLFDADEASTVTIDEIGSAYLGATQYYFKFADGKFKYGTSLSGSLTTLSPSPAISTSNPIFWEVLDDKLFFVDGTNVLRYFNGTAIKTSSIYARPTVALTTSGGGTGYDYVYTVDNGLGESPAASAALTNVGSAVTVRIPANTGPQTLIAGDIVRVYSRATGVAATSKLVSVEYTWTASDVTTGYKDLATVAIADTQTQLYSELGQALNKTAPTGLSGITVHYGRLVGWKDDTVYNSKVTNPHSWPDQQANHEAFVYDFGAGDTEEIQRCISYRESLYVLKETKIAVFGGIGPDDTGNNAYSFRRLETNGIGCIAPKSAIVVGELESSYLVFLSPYGFFASNGNGVKRIGEKIEPAIRAFSRANLETACAFHHKTEGIYYCFLGDPENRVAYVLDTRADNGHMVGWWKQTDVNAKCAHYDEDRYLMGTSQGTCFVENVAGDATDYADDYCVDAVLTDGFGFVDFGSVEAANNYPTGTEVRFRTQTTLPTGLSPNTIYYAINYDVQPFIRVATTLANAQAGTYISFGVAAQTNHVVVAKRGIDAYYTTNWINGGSAALVKKVSRLCTVLNAAAEQINLSIEIAYDWFPSFSDAKTVTTGASDPWGESPWGSQPWSQAATAAPRNIAFERKKARSFRLKFSNSTVNEDFNLQGIEFESALIRNRGNFA